jgi:beta-phosphoglucomutase-like phosphatase (HAD superfamily)
MSPRNCLQMLVGIKALCIAVSLRPSSHARASLRLSHQPVIPGISAVAAKYDAVLLDQFGVLHDGMAALPDAVDCYEQLSASGKQLVVLSNTSRRRAFAMRKLPDLGFDPAAAH